MAKLAKADFTQVDGHWICVLRNLNLSLEQNINGEFKLMILGTLEPIPAATAYPSEPEWDAALELANRLKDIIEMAERRSH